MALVGAVLLAIFVLEAPWNLVVVVAGALVEVGESTFWIWLSRRRRPKVGVEAMIGQEATVVLPCRPVGLVRIHGELWHARSDDGADAGETVRVQAVEGLTLVVER